MQYFRTSLYQAEQNIKSFNQDKIKVTCFNLLLSGSAVDQSGACSNGCLFQQLHSYLALQILLVSP